MELLDSHRTLKLRLTTGGYEYDRFTLWRRGLPAAMEEYKRERL